MGFGIAAYQISRSPDLGIFGGMVARSNLLWRDSAQLELTEMGPMLDLGCVGNEEKIHETIPKNQGSVRMKGRFCHLSGTSMEKFEGVRVRNSSTGADGIVFLFGNDNSFITDYLVLRTGNNLFRLEWSEPKSGANRAVYAELSEQ